MSQKTGNVIRPNSQKMGMVKQGMVVDRDPRSVTVPSEKVKHDRKPKS